MPTIKLTTIINAPIEKCFDLARSIDLHLISTAETEERVVDGRKTGLCEVNDEITWEAKHFGIRQRLTSRITKMEYPTYFSDKMLKGAFKSILHEHFFENCKNQTVMKDVFNYETPFGIIGKLFDLLVLKNYLTNFLIKRNNILKEYAEKEI